MSAMFASADILRGKIVDKQTKLPVEGASVEVTSREGNRIQMSTCTTDSSGIFTNRSDLINTTIVVQAIGYYERTLRHPCFEGSDTIELNDIEIRPSEIFLNNLEVTAKAKRFTLRGDTIVFNPNAFSLEAGERLEALIQKLPGVKIESDGTLSWNGRPVRLMMNGQKALDSSLIGQLPVEAVKEIKSYIIEKLKVSSSIKRDAVQHTLFPKNRFELKEMINAEISKNGNECSLNHIDVSSITDMSKLFYYSKFNGDISEWNVSNVTNMSYMFYNSKFNGYISNWNVSNVEDMSKMFRESTFNGDISDWDVSRVTNMREMFTFSKFIGDISEWNVLNVENMDGMFHGSAFNGDISRWNVSNVTDMYSMFEDSKFNGNISKWNVSKVKNMAYMFARTPLENNPPKWYK